MYKKTSPNYIRFKRIEDKINHALSLEDSAHMAVYVCDLFNTYQQKEECLIMPRNNKKSTKGYGGNAFVNHRLSREEKQSFVHWSEENYPNLAAILETVLVEGYRISLKFNLEYDFFSATLTPITDEDKNTGYILSSKAPDPMQAILISLYKHLVLCEGDIWKSLDKDEDWG